MRRVLSLLLVAAIAYLAGAASANGSLARLLATAGLHIGSTAVPGPMPSATASPAPSGGTVPPAATVLRDTPPSATALPPAVSPTRPAPTPTATPSRLPTPPAAIALAQKASGGTLLPAGGWAGAGGLTLQVVAPPSALDMRAEVEVRPVGQPFTGVPTAYAPVAQDAAMIPLRGLAAGQYHWQTRLTSAGGIGNWTPFARDGTAFGIHLMPPSAPIASSPTDPKPGATYATSVASFAWSMPSDPTGVAGFSYRLDTNPRGAAPPRIRTRAQQALIAGLVTGSYFFHVRAVDGVGNWGPSTTFPIHVDVTPPQLTHTHVSCSVPNCYYFNPAVEALRLDYTLTKVATVTVGIYNDAGVRIRHIVPSELMPAGIPLKVLWDGRDNQGVTAPPGQYGIWLRATDRLGNVSVTPWGYYNLTSRRIVVSLSQQELWAYDSDKLLLSTLVTTGNKALPTPTGVYHIEFARHPFTFISPWPKGSLYYYLPSKVTYALYFKDYGFYIHDSPWRHTYGPGTNATLGQPGTDYTGTHGCINVPYDAMAKLYAWATPGTAVEIDP